MKAQPNPGASGLGGAPQYAWGSTDWNSALGAWRAALARVVQEPAEAAMAVMSRGANHALSLQIQHAFAAATRARDCARDAAAKAARALPAGGRRTALIKALAQQETDAGRAMQAVLRFGREHGHLAFAFPPPH